MRRGFLLAVAGALCACGSSGADGMTMPTRDEHSSRYFPITPGTAHVDATCEDCHHGNDDTTNFDSFRKFDCLRCHADDPADPGQEPDAVGAAALATVHADQPEFPDLANPNPAVPSAACMLCHADGTASGVDHATKFPIGPSTAHSAQRCGDCHQDLSNRKNVSCAGCHTSAEAATQHVAVKSDPATGYAFDSGMCLRCHVESQVDRVASHLPFGIASGKHGPQTNGECLKCHPALRTDRPRGADFGVKDCLGCHARAETDAKHQGEREYSYATAACLDCHRDGIAGND